MRTWLSWAAVPYALVAGLKARLYRAGWLRQRKLRVPVISIGNLTVGGTGKTPIVILIAEWLSAEGKRVGILSRGYRRTGSQAQLLVSDGERVFAGPEDAGDEPYLMANRCPRAVIAVGADRYGLGLWVLERFPIDCLLLDDGYQHMALHRDLNVLLLDATDAAGLDGVLPAGRLREPLEAAARADLIVITRADQRRQVEEVVRKLPNVPAAADPIQAVFRAEGVLSVTTGAAHPPQWCEGKSAVLCSGVGHAESFRSTAESLGFNVLDEVIFRDHHHYEREDIARVRLAAAKSGAELIVTTEKDAAKVARWLAPADPHWWAIRLGVDMAGGEARLRETILRVARRAPLEVCA